MSPHVHIHCLCFVCPLQADRQAQYAALSASGVSAAVPAAPVAVHVPNIAAFPVPDQWVRPAFLPATPPPPPAPQQEESPAENSGTHDEERGGAPDDVNSASASSPADADGATKEGTGDAMEVEGEGEEAGKIDGKEGEKEPVAPATREPMQEEEEGEEVAPKSRGDDGKQKPTAAVVDAEGSEGKEVAKEEKKGDDMDEEEEDDKEEKDDEEEDEEVRAAREKAEQEKESARKESEEAEAVAAATNAAAKAKAEAEVAKQAEALKQAAAARKAEVEEKAVEARTRGLRVNAILERLRKDADARKQTGRYAPPNQQRYSQRALMEAGGAARGRRRGGGRGVSAVVAVPRLRDRSRGDGDKGRDGSGAPGDAPEGGVEGSVEEAGTDWPLLGQRRLKRQLDRTRRCAALARGPGPGQRLSSIFVASQDALERSKVGGGVGWLEAKLARMRKIEDGEWRTWQRRVAEEQASNPGEAAGPSLPFGFVPRLAHRALGAYAIVRTLSRPFRLTPAPTVAFLRAMSLKLRTPLLDAAHYELLRRVCCLLKGRSGGWSKGSSAQKELDWRYLDEVRARGGTRGVAVYIGRARAYIMWLFLLFWVCFHVDVPWRALWRSKRWRYFCPWWGKMIILYIACSNGEFRTWLGCPYSFQRLAFFHAQPCGLPRPSRAFAVRLKRNCLDMCPLRRLLTVPINVQYMSWCARLMRCVYCTLVFFYFMFFFVL